MFLLTKSNNEQIKNANNNNNNYYYYNQTMSSTTNNKFTISTSVATAALLLLSNTATGVQGQGWESPQTKCCYNNGGDYDIVTAQDGSQSGVCNKDGTTTPADEFYDEYCPDGIITSSPTESPTDSPTWSPTDFPTDSPTRRRTRRPTRSPTKPPTRPPTRTRSPTPSPTPPPASGIQVYATNTCEGTDYVQGTFHLVGSKKNIFGHHITSTKDVNVTFGDCTYVGETESDGIAFNTKGSTYVNSTTVPVTRVETGHFLASWTQSCEAIGRSNDDKCALYGMGEGACIINLC